MSSHLSNVSWEGVHIDEEVYVVLCEDIHASSVICRRIDMVHSDCVDSQGLHQSCVARALCGIDKRIAFLKLIGNTCRKKPWLAHWIVIRCGMRYL